MVVPYEDMEAASDPISPVVSSLPAISYVARAKVDTLLGDVGGRVLKRVLGVINSSAASLRWPLVKIEVRHTRDSEVQDWQYVLIVLAFDCSFEKADEHLHEFYDKLDRLAKSLSEEERKLLGRLLFFDVATTRVPGA